MCVADQLVELIGPEPVDLRLQPVQAARHDPVDPLATDLLGLHQSGIGQQQQVLGDRRPRHRELGSNLADGSGLCRQELQDASPVGLGSCRQRVGHE